MNVELECNRCEKPEYLCVCADLRPARNRTRVLILQHPQEPDKALGTARLTALGLKRAELRTGLSWRSLRAILGEEVTHRRWLVLYLGSAKLPPKAPASPVLTLVDAKGKPLDDDRQTLRDIEGLVLLDGTWSQAKALWWRNAWLLKLQRGVLHVPGKSKYGVLRKEPRRESVSTLEATAYCLDILDRNKEATSTLLPLFDRLLEAYRGGAKRPPPTVES